MSLNLTNNPIGKAPDFICIGAQKAGTEWLYEQLMHHPEVWMPPIRELHYFDSPQRFFDKYQIRSLCSKSFIKRLRRIGRFLPNRIDLRFYKAAREIRHLLNADTTAYKRLFCADPSLVTGDITPAYSTLDSTVIENIARAYPQTKVVFLIRNPIERLWSQLCKEIRKGKIDADITHQPDMVIAFANTPFAQLRSYPSVIHEKWSAHIPAERLGCFFFDDLQQNPVEFRRKIFDFLSLNSDQCNCDANNNRKANHKKIQMPGATREALTHHFENEIRQCQERFGKPCSDWL